MLKNYFVIFLLGISIVRCGSTEYDLDEMESESVIGFLSGVIAITESNATFSARRLSSSACQTVESLSCSDSTLSIEYPTARGTGLTSAATVGASTSMLAHSRDNGCSFNLPSHVSQTWFEGRKTATFSGGATCSTTPKNNSTGKMVIKHVGNVIEYAGPKHYGELSSVYGATANVVYRNNAFHSAYVVGHSADEVGIFITAPQQGNDSGITVSFSGLGANQVRSILINNAHVATLTQAGVVKGDAVVYNPKGTINNGVQSTFVSTGSFDLGNGQVSVTLQNGAVTTEHLLGGYITQTEIEEPLIFVRGCPWPVRGKIKTTLRASYNSLQFKKDSWENDGKYEYIVFDKISDITNSDSVSSELCGRVNFKHFSHEEYSEKQLAKFF